MVKALYLPVDENERVIETEAGLKGLQALVGGYIEAFSPLFGDTPLLWVNDSGMLEGFPNRAAYATREMEEAGYLSQIDGSEVREEDLYAILYGPIVAVSYEVDPVTEEKRARDITEEEISLVKEYLGGPGSGLAEALVLYLRAKVS